jgi:hypothetical protein
MDITSLVGNDYDIHINMVTSLDSLKETIATARMLKIPYDKLFGVFRKYSVQNSNAKSKDTYAYNLTQNRPCTKEAYMAELYKKYLAKPSQSWSINTDKKRTELADKNFSSTGAGDITFRRKQSIKACGAVIFDFDNADDSRIIAPAEVLTKLNAQAFDYIAYSTYSSKPLRPKFRVIIPMNEYVKPIHYEKVCALLTYIIDPGYTGCLYGGIDTTCFQPFRFFYLPTSPGVYVATDGEIPDTSGSWIVTKKSYRCVDVEKCALEYELRDPHRVITIEEIEDRKKKINKLSRDKK